ncbi:MAG: beta-glucanase/beta-glucan synthetase, partial [Mycobacterium sp.]|nr:beta-glucanase/beta-glucan synthetase [Mycobacterium sp.]
MLMTGIGLLGAAVAVPEASARPLRVDAPAAPPPAAPPPNGQYLFVDDFDGPAGSSPDLSKWEVAQARETMEEPTFWELPENVGQYRDDRRNVYLDGKSNLV